MLAFQSVRPLNSNDFFKFSQGCCGMKFERVAQQFELIEKESSRLAMTQLLADLFKQSTVEEIEIICNLSLGILRPVYLGNQFKFAEKSLINVVAIALDKSIAEITQKTKEVGDLGQVFTDGKKAG